VRWDEKAGCWVVRVTVNGKRHPPIRMPGIPREDEDRAAYMGKVTSRRVRDLGAVPAESRETVNEYATRWLEAREGRVASVRDNRGHLTLHVLPTIGTLEMGKVGREDIERVVSALDAKVRAGSMSAKTASNVWGTLSKVFDDATNAKPAEGLRCLQRDPTDGVRGPDDDSADKLLQFLYPSEFYAFVSCDDVPLAWRRNVAIAVYLALRDGEQRALKWPNVDLEHGVITVAERFDRRANEDREGTKTGAARQIPIPVNLLPLLEAMHEESDDGYVCDLPSLRDMARGLRRWLRNAGVEREALHYGTTVSKPLRWHDLRATGLTWLAVEGQSPSAIRDIAGHTQTAMTDRYVRSAAMLRGGRFGLPFPTLPAALLEPSEVSVLKRQNPPVVPEGFAESSRISDDCWRGGRGSKKRQNGHVSAPDPTHCPEKTATVANEPPPPAAPVLAESRPLQAEGGDDLERLTAGIVAAAAAGDGDLARRLLDLRDELVRGRAGNVVSIAKGKRAGS